MANLDFNGKASSCLFEDGKFFAIGNFAKVKNTSETCAGLIGVISDVIKTSQETLILVSFDIPYRDPEKVKAFLKKYNIRVRCPEAKNEMLETVGTTFSPDMLEPVSRFRKADVYTVFYTYIDNGVSVEKSELFFGEEEAENKAMEAIFRFRASPAYEKWSENENFTESNDENRWQCGVSENAKVEIVLTKETVSYTENSAYPVFSEYKASEYGKIVRNYAIDFYDKRLISLEEYEKLIAFSQTINDEDFVMARMEGTTAFLEDEMIKGLVERCIEIIREGKVFPRPAQYGCYAIDDIIGEFFDLGNIVSGNEED